MIKNICFFLTLSFLLTACGFHLQQGNKNIAPPLKRMQLKTPDPYGILAKTLKLYLETSNIKIVNNSEESETILSILRDDESQTLLSVGATQQTRQYQLRVDVTFEITDNQGRTLIGPETVAETRVITITSNQILGSSNEANLFYQQIRRSLAYAIMNRIASQEVTARVNAAFEKPTKKHVKKAT